MVGTVGELFGVLVNNVRLANFYSIRRDIGSQWRVANRCLSL